MLHSSPRALGCVALVALLAAGPATAQDDEDEISETAQPGFYLTGMGVLSFQISDEDDFSESFLDREQVRTHVDPALGLDVRAGYRVHPKWALEGSFNWLTNRDYESKDVATGEKFESLVRSWNVTGNVKYFLLTDRFQPYLLAGAGYGRVSSKVRSGPAVPIDRSVTEEGFVARFAGGFSHYVKWNTALTFEAGYLMPTGSITNADQLFFNWGITLRFYGDSY